MAKIDRKYRRMQEQKRAREERRKLVKVGKKLAYVKGAWTIIDAPKPYVKTAKEQ